MVVSRDTHRQSHRSDNNANYIWIIITRINLFAGQYGSEKVDDGSSCPIYPLALKFSEYSPLPGPLSLAIFLFAATCSVLEHSVEYVQKQYPYCVNGCALSRSGRPAPLHHLSRIIIIINCGAWQRRETNKPHPTRVRLFLSLSFSLSLYLISLSI